MCLESINQSLVAQLSEVLFLHDLSRGYEDASANKVLAKGKD